MMYHKEVNEQSPLRILERSIHGGLGAGNLGVVMARAGVGKTAFLVQIAIDEAMRGRDILHIALDQDLTHVHAWYVAIFDDLAEITELEDRENVRAEMKKHRIIQAFADQNLTAERMKKVIDLYSEHANLKPSAIVIDGFQWDGDADEVRDHIAGLKATAKELNAELWMTAQTHRDTIPENPTELTRPCKKAEELIDVAVFLQPQENYVAIRLLKDHDEVPPPDVELKLNPETMRVCTNPGGAGKDVTLPASAHTLLSGGAKGAENAFGEIAEKWHVQEINYTFAGREPERKINMVELSENQLHQGDVSATYVQEHLNRKLPNTPTFNKILQTIWHQVVTAGQVFVIGVIQEDNTVKGGTGWATELARKFNKPVHVFDQERKGWFVWQDDAWVAEETPRITRSRFTGTGTRFLSNEGREAIEMLFAASFGS